MTSPTLAAAAARRKSPNLGYALYRPLVRSALLVGAMFAAGVLGYAVIGGDEYTLLDAVYMTTITLTTVGYGEVIDLSENPKGQIFTTLLLLGGVGSFVYFFSNLTAFLVEGSIQQMLWRKRMDARIAHLDGHTIICGGGNTGQHIVAELLATERPFVLIDNDADRVAGLMADLDAEFPVVLGDATEDEALIEAGIERALGLVACVSCDKDNLIVLVSSKLLKPSLRVICRCVDVRFEAKIRKAGADGVVSPCRIGGLRMVSEMVRPTAVSFLDQMLRDGQRRLRVESTPIAAGSTLDGATIRDVWRRALPDFVVLALLEPDGSWHYSPTAETRLTPGVALVHCSGPAGRQALEELARAGAAS